MPKGGDLHNHLDGAIYAEDLLDFAAIDNFCVDRTTSRLLGAPCDSCEHYTPKPAVRCAYDDHILYDQIIDAWSMRNWRPGDESGHDHFFATFDKFALASHNHVAEAVATVINRAASEHVQYIEFMHTADGRAAAQLGMKSGMGRRLRQDARKTSCRRPERNYRRDQQDAGGRRRPRPHRTEMRNRRRRTRMQRHRSLSLPGAARPAAGSRLRADRARLRTRLLRSALCRIESGHAGRLVRSHSRFQPAHGHARLSARRLSQSAHQPARGRTCDGTGEARRSLLSHSRLGRARPCRAHRPRRRRDARKRSHRR